MRALADIADQISDGRAAPVETWHPESCGTMDLRIARDGVWWHEGRPIERDALVALFARVLRREEDGSYVLVTPVEKLTIEVEDAPFVMTDWRFDAGSAAFNVSHVGWLKAGASHPLRLVSDKAFKPYLLVRGRLEALASRSLAQDVALAADEDGLWAGGIRFPFS